MSLSKSDFILIWILRVLAVVAAAITALIIIFVVMESFPILKAIGPLPFFTGNSWHPKEGFFNLVPMLVASVLASLGAIFLAAPLGIFSGLFSRFYAPPLVALVYRRLFELLGGVPSVVYGFWGLTVLVPWIGEKFPPGSSLLAGIIILAIMVLPTMSLAADSTFASVPPQYISGAAALGFSRLRTIVSVILPCVRPSLYSALILQAGRAIGETMAILMVTGNIVQWPESIFSPVRTLTANMALEMAYASDNHRSALFVSGLILILMIIFFVTVAQKIETGRPRA